MHFYTNLLQATFDFFLHFEVVLEKEHTTALGEAATEHSIVTDALVLNDFIGHISGKVDPVGCEEADTAGQKRDGQQQKSDSACQTHGGLCSRVPTCKNINNYCERQRERRESV